MAFYAVGDIQGCCDALDRLLCEIRFDPDVDHLLLVGDLVNRGPESLRTLRRVRALGRAATAVLGNHDLHLLAAWLGVRPLSSADTLAEVLGAPDAADLIDWVRHKPLAHRLKFAGETFLLVHAGVLPTWSAADALTRASEVEHALRHTDWAQFIGHMYGDKPDRWDDGLQGFERLRLIVNAFTRMRFCSDEGVLDLKTKEGAQSAPPGYKPWFEVPGRRAADTTILFGHWSTLGWVEQSNLLGLDTGCVWGGMLTAVRLEDRHRVQIQCPQYRRPG